MAMEMTGEYRIPAPRNQVWEALNDPEILRQCIPGCEAMEKEADDSYTARMLAKIGPVKARFATSIALSNLNPPESYTISGEGKGGPAGFGKGSAEVKLSDEAGETVLRYSASMQVGGKLAQVGSRLVAGTAKKYADDFFSRFASLVSEGDGAAG
ncbi:MAG: carbon monoxide dehydrogenase subunit G [Gammaproteobacteria bacterium]|nr:carbon monoxide dehydrogenase subunit G [Gammaproteobacteria bacterium]